ncbi:MAG: SPOR domain-containing protein, partial [Burkholderiaceae bacterium]
AARADGPNLASERPASALSPAPPPSRGQPGAAAAVAPKTGSAASVRPPAPLAPGRWAVQVGVFAVAANAERDRERVAARLASTDVAAAQSIVRVERIGNRSHVLVGDLPDREAAQALAAQLRRVLRQDVVVLRR